MAQMNLTYATTFILRAISQGRPYGFEIMDVNRSAKRNRLSGAATPGSLRLYSRCVGQTNKQGWRAAPSLLSDHEGRTGVSLSGGRTVSVVGGRW